MQHSIETIWKKGMEFEATIDGFKITLDTAVENGGKNKGPRPKALMLVALAGCTGMDVVSILEKMRVKIEGLKIIVNGDLHEEHPKKYIKMHIIYSFKGIELALEKLQKAVDLSQEKYCGVLALYKQAVTITSEIKLE